MLVIALPAMTMGFLDILFCSPPTAKPSKPTVPFCGNSAVAWVPKWRERVIGTEDSLRSTKKDLNTKGKSKAASMHKTQSKGWFGLGQASTQR